MFTLPRVKVDCAYKQFLEYPVRTDDTMILMARSFVQHSGSLLTCRPSQSVECRRDEWDGIALFPALPPGVDYVDWLRYIVVAADRILRARRYVLDVSAIVGWSPDDIRLLATTAHPEGVEAYPARFQLGFAYPGVAPSELVCRDEREQPMEIGVALYILTYLASRGLIAAPMRVDCPRTVGSPCANDRFNDNLRWDVQPPLGDVPGIIALDWNWNTRARVLHGVATMEAL